MANSFFRFKQFTIHQQHAAMKVTTDGCLFGAWCAEQLRLQQPPPERVLDIGTGTGLLALMVAQKNNVLIDAVEIDPSAASEAVENCQTAAFGNRVHVLHTDFAVLSGREPYDAIICNPPFYENEIPSSDDKKNTAHHSRDLTLEQLFHSMRLHLQETGWCYLLLPFKRQEAINRMMKEAGMQVSEKITVRPTPKHAPFRIMVRCGFGKDVRTHEEQWTVQDNDKNYAPEFTALLRDYYLKL